MSFPWIMEVCANEVSSDIELEEGAASDLEPEIACESQDEHDSALSSGLYWTMPARVRISKSVKIRDNGMFRRACSSPCGKVSARETRIGRKPCFVQWIFMNDLDFNKKTPMLARFYLKLSYFRRANKSARSWKETPNAPAKTMVLDNINAVRTRVANACLSRTSEVTPESN